MCESWDIHYRCGHITPIHLACGNENCQAAIPDPQPLSINCVICREVARATKGPDVYLYGIGFTPEQLTGKGENGD
jgi:hypothetical protein